MALSIGLAAGAAQEHQHPDTHRGRRASPSGGREAEESRSTPTPRPIAAGKQLYDKQCASCHGDTGKGDGKMAARTLNPKPANLADADWKHGSTDGEIFTLIRDGIEEHRHEAPTRAN